MADKKVFFSIPLASKMNDGMWEISVEILKLSLASILNQEDRDFTVLLCSHDRPNIPELDDERVEFLECTSPRIATIEEGIADKGRKRKQMFHEIGRRGGGYVVMIDADDFVSSRLVGHIRRTEAPHGYIFRTGYALDFESRNVAPIPGVWSKPFTFVCGSCAAIYFSPDDIQSKLISPRYAHQFKQHAQWEDVALSAGRPLSRVPFPCMIYTLNTPISMHARISESRNLRMKEICEGIERNRLDLDREFKDEFSLSWI